MLAGAQSTGSRTGGSLDCSPVILAHEQPFRIGAAEVRPATREVLLAGRASIIEPRVMQLLVALHRANGAVVSKDDLATLCWEGRIVGEDAINRVVSRLRAVAEKQAGGQFRVETITKVGYRLISTDKSPDAAIQVDRPPATGPAIRRRDLIVGGSAIGVAAAAGLGWSLFDRDGTPREARLLIDDARKSLYEGTVEQTGNAIGKLRQATQVAPRNAEAWGLLGYAYMREANVAPSDTKANLRVRGKESVARAFALEPRQPDALAGQLWATPLFRNWHAFEQASRAALRYHPHHAELNSILAALMMQVGRFRESVPLEDRALPRMPLSPPLHVCRSVALWGLGRLDEAEAAIAKAFELLPRHYGVWFTQLYFHMYNGRAGQAAAMIADTDSRPLGIPDWNYDLVALQANALASGNRAQIAKAVDTWKKAAERGTGFAINASMFASFVGDVGEAFRVLNALYFNRGFVLPDNYFSREQGMYSGGERFTYNLFHPVMAPARRDPRFAVLTRELGLDDYWQRTGSRGLVLT